MAKRAGIASLQLVIPGCERQTLPRSSSAANECGQGLLAFYAEPTLREKLTCKTAFPLTARKAQKPLPKAGLFRG